MKCNFKNEEMMSGPVGPIPVKEPMCDLKLRGTCDGEENCIFFGPKDIQIVLKHKGEEP